MPVHGLDHVQLAIPPGGEDEARSFYGGVLGLAEVAKPAPLATRGGCWFESGGARIHLGVEHDFRPARKAHPALVVSDLASLVRDLQAAGYEVVHAEPLDGCTRVHTYDPFGNRLELVEPAST